MKSGRRSVVEVKRQVQDRILEETGRGLTSSSEISVPIGTGRSDVPRFRTLDRRASDRTCSVSGRCAAETERRSTRMGARNSNLGIQRCSNIDTWLSRSFDEEKGQWRSSRLNASHTYVSVLRVVLQDSHNKFDRSVGIESRANFESVRSQFGKERNEFCVAKSPSRQ